MTFRSILFFNSENISQDEGQLKIPDFFHDLNLDQVIDAVISGKEEYNLKPFFYRCQCTSDEILFRQEIMSELENPELKRHFDRFAGSMQNMRKQLALLDKFHHKYQKERLFLDVVEIYCDALNELSRNLSNGRLKSQGLSNFRDYLKEYVLSETFTLLFNETKSLVASLSSVKYCIYIDGLKVQVRNYNSEADYTREVEDTFARFKEGSVKDYRITFSNPLVMNQVEELILDGVAQLYPDLFAKLDVFFEINNGFNDKVISTFDREIQFYLAYLDYISIFKEAGLHFCYPLISDEKIDIYAQGSFDLALAFRHIHEKSAIVSNDFFLKDKERVLVISGPNQGGKTTFARLFGQIHYLAGIGCPVPGSNARLFLYDRLFTHFEKEENIRNLRGKLQDELFRIHRIISQSTGDSLIIINEILTSTTLQDQIFLSKKIMHQINDLDLYCVWVTFIDELALYSESTVSMVSSIVPGDPALRTFKITRKPPDGLAYAQSIAEKHRVTYELIMDRIKS